MRTQLRSVFAKLASLGLSLALAATLVFGWGIFAYDSAMAVPAMVLGNVVLARPSVQDVGTLAVGRAHNATFDLINLTSEPIFINGAKAPCTCVKVEQLPMKLFPGKSRPFKLMIVPTPAQVGLPFTQTIDLHLSVPGPKIALTVAGRVSPGTTPP